MSVLDGISFGFTWNGAVLDVSLNNRDVSGLIRTKEVGAMASVVSVYPEVRSKLFEIQQEYANSESLVMDGRDIGTVIIPNAELKVFVDADVNERARRRCMELQAKGESVNVEDIAADLRERDHRDRNRPIAPLKRADDAKLLDTTTLTIEQGIAKILSWVEVLS